MNGRMRRKLLVTGILGGSSWRTFLNDTFTDTDGTLLTAHAIAPTNTSALSWSNFKGTTKILGNKAVLNAVDATSKTSEVYVNSGYSDVKIDADLVYDTDATKLNYLTARMIDVGNGWKFSIFGGNFYIQQFTTGTGTDRATSAVTLSQGENYHVTLTLQGPSIIFTVKGVTISYTSSAYQANTIHGFGVYNFNTIHSNEAFDSYAIARLG